MNRPLKEHYEVYSDSGIMVRTFDYIAELEKYCNFIKSERLRCIETKIVLLESQLRDKDEEIASWKEERDNVLNDFELYRAEKDKEIEAFKDIENIRSQATKSVCKENYDLRDEIDRLKDLFEKRGSSMQDLSEQVALLSTKSEELREALREALTYIDFNDMDGSLDFSKRCRKLIAE